MNKYAILCIDEDPLVLHQLQRDLKSLDSHFTIQSALSAGEARARIARMQQGGQQLALVLCEQLLPDGSGIELLIELNRSTFTRDTRKLLVTELEDAGSIIDAVNHGRLEYFFKKPWESRQLLSVVSDQLTTYLMAREEDLLPYAAVLDQQRIVKAQVDRQMARFREGFIDYSSYSDQQLSQHVIQALHRFFENNDETHACRCYSPEHLLTQEGEPNAFLWFVVDGQVALTRRGSGGGEHQVAICEAGSLVGSMSFVTGERAFTTGITLTPTEVIKLDKHLFAKVMSSSSELLPLFTNLLLRQFNWRLRNSVQTELRLKDTLQSLEVAHQQLIESEKMAILGQLMAGIAHELNNPVAAISRGADTLKQILPSLPGCRLDDDYLELANRTLIKALQVHPLPTAEIRSRSRALEKRVGNLAIAKKLVEMGLDEELCFEAYFAHLGPRLSEVVGQLDRFHQAGSLLRNIHVCAGRIAELVKGLKHYAGADGERPRQVDIHEGIEDTLMIFENRLRGYEVERDFQPLPKIECYPIALQQVWTNLIANAIDATGTQGRLAIRSRYLPRGLRERPAVEVVVEDNGQGISPELQQKIFELNFSTKREGQFGLGIGLTICAQIVSKHQGTIRVESQPSQFTRFIVTLPLKLIDASSAGGIASSKVPERQG